MSRCFPFPPPGYEKKPKNDQVDLLTKEKQKEKKHKKEKKDKEKREGKEKKDKDRSKDKHREKKDRKEKHKDKKKDKERDKDKNKGSDGARVEERTGLHNEEKSADVVFKDTEKIKDSKFAEELGRRIRDEEKVAATKMLESAAGSTQKRIGNVSTGAAVNNSNRKGSENMAVETSLTTSTPKSNESKPNAVPVTSSAQKGIETMGNTAGITFSVQRKTDGMGTATAVCGSFPKRSDSMANAVAIENEKYAGGRMFPNDFCQEQRRNSQMCRPLEKDMENKFHKKIESMGIATGAPGSIPKRMESMGLAIAVEKERFTGNNMVQDFNNADQRRNDETARLLENDGDCKRVEAEKAKDREAGDRTGDGHKDRDREEKKKKKGKDKDKHKKEKEKDKMREKGERRHKEHDKAKDNAAPNDHIGNQNMKPLASQNDTERTIYSDGNIKKRKDIGVNGFLHEDDSRPNKFPRPVSSSCLPAENGRTAEPYHTPTPNSSIKHGLTNNTKAPIVQDFKDLKMNGLRKVQPSSADLGTSAAVKSVNGEPPPKPPHPDSKYLSQIYSVPKMEELPEYDDQEWLFSNKIRKQEMRSKLESEEPPQVWDSTMRIESADVLALPYVIPY